MVRDNGDAVNVRMEDGKGNTVFHAQAFQPQGSMWKAIPVSHVKTYANYGTSRSKERIVGRMVLAALQQQRNAQ